MTAFEEPYLSVYQEYKNMTWFIQMSDLWIASILVVYKKVNLVTQVINLSLL